MRSTLPGLLALLCSFANTNVQAAILSVGDTADCDIQITASNAQTFRDAVLSAQDFDIFRLALPDISVNLTIQESEVQIDGGYPSCADAEADRNQSTDGTLLRGVEDAAVVDVRGAGGRNTGSTSDVAFPLQPFNVSLVNVTLTEGGGFWSEAAASRFPASRRCVLSIAS